jgi:hypothetical protein
VKLTVSRGLNLLDNIIADIRLEIVTKSVTSYQISVPLGSNVVFCTHLDEFSSRPHLAKPQRTGQHDATQFLAFSVSSIHRSLTGLPWDNPHQALLHIRLPYPLDENLVQMIWSVG